MKKNIIIKKIKIMIFIIIHIQNIVIIVIQNTEKKVKKKDDKIRNFYEERRKVRERSRSNSALRVMKVRI